ncbi:MAG: hypothetical protein AB7I32_04755 [Gammaproteobacteria bacterium]
MNIDFDDGESGFWEARTLYAMATHYVVKSPQEGDEALLDFLKDAALSHMNRIEYAKLREEVGISEPEWPTWSLVNNFWRRTLGPSRLEEDLSQQRSAALERADRAERSAFEALAETARIGRDRDQLKAEVERLRKEVARLEEDLTGVGHREPGD